MTKLMIVYGTVEGHTRKIAEFLGKRFAEAGSEVIEVEASYPGYDPHLDEFDGVIVCAPVHQGRHPEAVAAFVRANLEALSRMPSALLSVSLSAASAEEEYQKEALSYIDSFRAETGWSPDVEMTVAGALLYTQYDFLKRLMMRMISRRRGGDIDMSRDFVYTDWAALEAFAADFVEMTERYPALHAVH